MITSTFAVPPPTLFLPHERFAPTPEHLAGLARGEPAPLSKVEFLDGFFDTPERDLCTKNIWLRCRDNVAQRRHSVDWTLKEVGVTQITQYTGKSNIMKELARLFGRRKRDPAINPCTYCGQCIAITRTMRYTYPGYYIDVCYQKPGQFYVVGTLIDLSLRDSLNASPSVPSTVAAYAQRYHPELVGGRSIPSIEHQLFTSNPIETWVMVHFPLNDSDSDEEYSEDD